MSHSRPLTDPYSSCPVSLLLALTGSHRNRNRNRPATNRSNDPGFAGFLRFSLGRPVPASRFASQSGRITDRLVFRSGRFPTCSSLPLRASLSVLSLSPTPGLSSSRPPPISPVLCSRSGKTAEVSGPGVEGSRLRPLRTSSSPFRLPALPPPPSVSLGLAPALGPVAVVSRTGV